MSLLLETIQTEGVAALSYLIGDDKTGTAAVIDPRPDGELYVELSGVNYFSLRAEAVPNCRQSERSSPATMAG